MSGKAWMFTLFTTALLITIHVHYAQSECYPGDLVSHLDDELLKDHWFQIKKFSDSKEPQLLSVINTLCLNWIKNTDKAVICDKENYKFRVITTFEGMLKKLFNRTEVGEIQLLCEEYNCTDGYEIQFVYKTELRKMYKEICNKSVSGLTCPSKSMPSSTSATSTTTTDSTRMSTSTSTNSTTPPVCTCIPPSTSATTSTDSTRTPVSTSATTFTDSTLGMPSSTLAYSTTSTDSTRTPLSTAATTFTDSTLGMPSSTLAYSTTSTDSTRIPPSTSATTSTDSTRMPLSTSATTLTDSTRTPLSTSATISTDSTRMPLSTSSTTLTDSTRTPLSTSATSTTSTDSTHWSATSLAATATPSYERFLSDPAKTLHIIYWFLGVSLLMNILQLWLFLCKKTRKNKKNLETKISETSENSNNEKETFLMKKRDATQEKETSQDSSVQIEN